MGSPSQDRDAGSNFLLGPPLLTAITAHSATGRRCAARRPEDPRPRDHRERFGGVGVARDPWVDV